MKALTPLRYPGGKARLGPWLGYVMRSNGLEGGTYAEPYAGGAGAAIYLLLRGYAGRVVINDLDPAVHAFWYCVLERTEQLVQKIEQTPVTMATWREQREVMLFAEEAGALELGFACFFLNRTNRSGILSGGVIGGKGQSGAWKLDARYNKLGLTARIREIAAQRERITLYGTDAAGLLACELRTLPAKSLVYLDPPYYEKGAALYRNAYCHDDHVQIAQQVLQLETPWIVTYDNHPRLADLYSSASSSEFALRYSTGAQRPHATEVMYYCGLQLPMTPKLTRSSACYPKQWDRLSADEAAIL